MSGLYVKLDVEYPTDDRLILAGPMAELLYVRGLCFCKRTMVDGIITVRQLAVVALGMSNADKHAQTLVDVEAWIPVMNGDVLVAWRIAAWLKRNKSVAQICDEREAKRRASVLANHTQHHVGKKPSPKCELCTADSGSEPADYER